MSKHALDAFRAKIAQDQTLRSEMTRILRAGGKKTAAIDELVAFAKSQGFDFTADEVRETELSDDQLDAVAGGASDIFAKLGDIKGESRD